MLEYIVTLAALLLSDLHDPRALVKVRRESYRVRRFLSLGDLLSAKMALCEVVFYIALAHHNHLLTRIEAMEAIMRCANPMGLSILDALELTEARYVQRVRAGNVVDLATERKVIKSYGG